MQQCEGFSFAFLEHNEGVEGDAERQVKLCGFSSGG